MFESTLYGGLCIKEMVYVAFLLGSSKHGNVFRASVGSWSVAAMLLLVQEHGLMDS